MKIIKILLKLLFVIIIFIVIAVFIFLKTFDVNKYKSQISQEIKNVLGRSVGIGHITLNLSLEQGISLDISGLKVADNPKFSKEDFLTIKDIKLGVDVLSFLTKRQILVSSAKIKSPKIILIRDQNGQFNVQTFQINAEKIGSTSLNITHTDDRSKDSSDSLAFAADSKTGNTKEKTLPPLLVQSIKLEDGLLAYRDLEFDPPLTIEVPQINLTVNNLSLTEPFNFSLEASLLSPRKNVSATGLAQIDTDTTNIHFNDIKITSDLSDISPQLLEHSLPMLRGIGLKDGMEGKLETSIGKMVVGPKGLVALSLDGTFKQGKIKLKQVPLPLNHIEAAFEGTENTIKIKGSSLNLGSGTVTAKGSIDDYLKGQDFHFETIISAIDLGEVIAQKDLPAQLQGKLYAEFNTEGKGLSGSSSMLSSLLGDGTVDVKEGKLVGMNILRLVLSKISMLPRLVEKIEKNLPDKYKDELQDKDTVLKKVKLTTKIKNGSLYIEDAKVETNVFLLSGKGTIGFNQEIDMQSTIAIPQDLSKAMVASAEGLQYLLDENNEIVIPLTVTGRIPSLAFLPDLEYLGKKIIMNRGKEELEKVLDKVFGKDKGTSETSPETGGQPSSEGSPSQTQPPQDEQKKRPERELIEGILDKIFK